MGDSQESAGIDVASRIQRFSLDSTPHLDSNSNNISHKKPNPAPRKRPQTTEVTYNSQRTPPQKDRNSVNRTASSPLTRKKPLIPAKPGVSPSSPSPTPRPKPSTKPSNVSNNIDNRKTSSGVKPAIPAKPTNIKGDASVNNNNNNVLTKVPVREKSWKQIAGPPQSPVPHMNDSKLPLKPLRGQQRMEVYETNDLQPNNKIISNNRSQCRRETLDGQMILGGPLPSVTVQNDSSSDEDSYSYPYEPPVNLQKRFPPSPCSQINEYDKADPKAVQDFMSSVNARAKTTTATTTTATTTKKPDNVKTSEDENYDDPEDLYQDPDGVNFTNPPIPAHKFSRTEPHISNSSDEENYDDPDDVADLYQDPDRIKFHKPPVDKTSNKNRNYITDNYAQSQNQSGQINRDSMDGNCLYEDPNNVNFTTNPLLKAQQGLKRQDSNYDSPLEDDDDIYSEPPPDALAPRKIPADVSSDDEEEYDFPDNEPPFVPHHKKSSEVPPPVPSHKKSDINSPPSIQGHDINNLDSSSSDEDENLYNDPENFFTKPPSVVDSLKNGSRMASLRRGSLQPLDYMPASTIQSDEYDDLYCDPNDAALLSKMPSVKTHGSDGEDIYSDEPLYQVYNAEILEEYHRQSKKKDKEENSNNHLTDDLMHKGSTMRILWSELPSVRNSGFLDTLSADDRKRQEAMFEVITSEASYLKSLDILVSHFMLNKEFLPNPNLPSPNDGATSCQQILDRQQYHFLFSGLSAIKGVSERFLKDLRKRQQSSILMESISDILLEYAENHLHCYVKYCSNQVFQDRTFQALLDSNTKFCDKLMELEKDPITQGLSLQSFLTLPMQRITRLPLLVDAICRRCEPGCEEFQKTDTALKALNELVRQSNEGTRQMERTEEMYFIQKNLVWKTRPIPLISTARWLVKKGEIMCLHDEGRFSQFKNQIRQIFKGKFKPVYLFLFTDILLVTKMKSDDKFKVIDACQRSLVKCEVLPNVPNPEPPRVGSLATLNINPLKYAFTLILLENANKKTVDYHCFLSTETDTTRWMEALNPPKSKESRVEGESIYDEWDCPQVQVIHQYIAQQSDELTLIEGDVISVLRKLPDGWAEGFRMRDDEKGWFPINYTDEINSNHIRAKNLMQRYRLINASKHVINEILGK